jgi:hypothetical protein
VFGRIVAMAGIRETSAFRRVHEAVSADPGAIFENEMFRECISRFGKFL